MLRLIGFLFPSWRVASEAKEIVRELVEVARNELTPLKYSEHRTEGLFLGSRFVTETSYFSLGFDFRDFEFTIRMRPPGVSSERLPPHSYQYTEPYAFREVFPRKESLAPHKARLIATIRECLKAFDPESHGSSSR